MELLNLTWLPLFVWSWHNEFLTNSVLFAFFAKLQWVLVAYGDSSLAVIYTPMIFKIMYLEYL